MVTLRDYYAV
jgi:hypothetical protein